MDDVDVGLLARSVDLARQARASANHPFGALLAGPDREVLIEAENTVVTEQDCTGHAETNLVRAASSQFDPEFLTRCTLYTSTEPCAMCAGAIYWAGIGRVVFALSEASLRELTGVNAANPTLALPCREVFSRGPRRIAVEGPALEDEVRLVHAGFWA
jgi:tRNA(Arg) A34 adenosine deaminase TadA